jgi:hypothetical protein
VWGLDGVDGVCDGRKGCRVVLLQTLLQPVFREPMLLVQVLCPLCNVKGVGIDAEMSLCKTFCQCVHKSLLCDPVVAHQPRLLLLYTFT